MISILQVLADLSSAHFVCGKRLILLRIIVDRTVVLLRILVNLGAMGASGGTVRMGTASAWEPYGGSRWAEQLRAVGGYGGGAV